MNFWRVFWFLMLLNAVQMSYKIFYNPTLIELKGHANVEMVKRYNAIALKQQNFVYDWANACDKWNLSFAIDILILSQFFKWHFSRAALMLLVIHSLFEKLDGFDELLNSNTTIPIIEFAAYFALIAAVVFAKYRYGDRCG